MSLFSGKAGFVTGAAGGIGRASAIAFARDGASVIVADTEASRARSEETVEMIGRPAERPSSCRWMSLGPIRYRRS